MWALQQYWQYWSTTHRLLSVVRNKISTGLFSLFQTTTRSTDAQEVAQTALTGQTEPQSSLLFSAMSMWQSNTPISIWKDAQGFPNPLISVVDKCHSRGPKDSSRLGLSAHPTYTCRLLRCATQTLPWKFCKAEHHHIDWQLREISRLRFVAACYASLIRVWTTDAQQTVARRNCRRKDQRLPPPHTQYAHTQSSHAVRTTGKLTVNLLHFGSA